MPPAQPNPPANFSPNPNPQPPTNPAKPPPPAPLSQPPPVNIPPPQPATNVPTGPKKIGKKSLTLIAVSIFIFLALAGGIGYYYFYLIPKRISAEYVKNSQPILVNLRTEVNRLYDEDFSARKNVLEDNEEARAVLLKHTENTKATISKISDLNNQYNSLKVSRLDSARADEHKQAFFLAHTIATDYLASLKLSGHIFNAYYDSLIGKLETFSRLIGSGGRRADFVAAADAVTSAADEAIEKLSTLDEPNQDDQVFYDNMVQNLKDIQYHFTKIRQYYVSGDDHLGAAEIVKLSHKIETNNQTTEKIVKDYVENSTIAERFRKFKSLDI